MHHNYIPITKSKYNFAGQRSQQYNRGILNYNVTKPQPLNIINNNKKDPKCE